MQDTDADLASGELEVLLLEDEVGRRLQDWGVVEGEFGRWRIGMNKTVERVGSVLLAVCVLSMMHLMKLRVRSGIGSR